MPPPKMQSVGKNQSPTLTTNEYENYKKEIEQRVQIIQAGLGSVGLRSAVLNTQELIELFYGIYNPEEASKQKLTQIEHLTSNIVESEKSKEANEPTPTTTK